jgi:hypothetical protein
MVIFVIPFVYFIVTRLSGSISALSWVLSTVLPGFFLFCFYSVTVDFYSLSLLAISFLLFGIVYENGYIQNDLITTKFEKNPTLRIDQSRVKFGVANIKYIFYIRTSIIFIFLIFGYRLTPSTAFIFKLIVLLFILQSLFYLYNSVRSRLNLFLIIPLSFFRLFGWILPFVSVGDYFAFIFLSLLMYPLCKFIELSTLPRYGFSALATLIGNIDLFRIKYYSAVVLLLFAASFMRAGLEIYLFISIYFLFFRIFSYALLENFVFFKSRLTHKFKNDKE